jgi:cytoplasmic FMR1 interacting protein
MQITPFGYVSKSPHYDPGKWPHCSSSSASPQGSFLIRLPSIREEHIRYITKLAQHSNEMSTARHDKVKSDEENKEIYDLALRGLHNLSKWTLHIIEVVSTFIFLSVVEHLLHDLGEAKVICCAH